jgi:acyl CoA:acetate/3-ketoacid CoA transferase beta subunit
VTARGVVTLVATNYGLFAPTGEGFAVKELAPGITFEAAQAATGAPLVEGR